MPTPFCSCQCKMCRAPGDAHCLAHPGCGAPAAAAAPPRPDELDVRRALASLKARAGTHSPSVVELDRALPGLVEIDACFLANPYATDVAVRRLRALPPAALERMVSHYPSQGAAIAELLAPYVGVSPEQLVVGNGASELMRELLSGSVLLSVPTFSAYYELAPGPVVTHRLDPRAGFRLDLDELDALVARHRPETVVIINPNNPDGGLVAHDELVDFVAGLAGRVGQVVVDESFGAFTSEAAPATLAGLVGELPHLVVLTSLGKSHGIAGLRLGYAVAAPERVRRIRAASLWSVNTLAEWFCGLLTDPGYVAEYERARRRYVRECRRFFADLDALPGARVHPSAANFALLELDRPAGAVAASLLARHGVYVRDCADKRGLDGARFLRVAARSEAENRRVAAALAPTLAERVALAA